MAATAVSMKTTTPFAEVASALRTWSGPAWLTNARHAAAARFEKAGLPTTRIEAWRTTPLPELPAKVYFPGFASTANRAQSLVAPFLADGASAIVFVDGFHSVTLSSAETELPAGVRMTPVSTLLAMKPDVIQPWMAGSDDSSGALHDLNLSLIHI